MSLISADKTPWIHVVTNLVDGVYVSCLCLAIYGNWATTSERECVEHESSWHDATMNA